ncbi:hypothetical protein CRYUN_Cryun20dG0073600 [Craigia yunnanensis]
MPLKPMKSLRRLVSLQPFLPFTLGSFFFFLFPCSCLLNHLLLTLFFYFIQDKKLSEDNVKDLSSDLQKLTDEYMKKIDSIYKQKEKELLTV